MDHSGIPVIALGFLLGMKHSLDVDHLAAVSTLLSGTGKTLKSVLVGMYWGFGHSLALLALGGTIILLDLRFPPAVSLVMEGVVGVMLLLLGGRVFYRLARGGVLHVHQHRHGDHLHLHPHIHGPERPRDAHREAAHHHAVPRAERPGRVPFLVGMVHGLAGSAGLTLILLPTIPTRAAGMIYLVVFGVGTVCGMAVSTLVLSLPLRMLRSREISGGGGRPGRAVTLLAGTVSICLGALLLWETWLPLLFPRAL